MIRHRINPIGGSEHAYCGEAFDAFDTGDSEVQGEFMDSEDMRSVSCPHCCEAIRAIRANLRGVKLAPSAQKGTL